MTNIYRADFPNAPAYFSNVDLKAAFYKKYSGLASGSLSDHMHAFFMRETGLGPGLGMGTYLKAFLAQTSAKSFKEWESGRYIETVRTNLVNNPAGTSTSSATGYALFPQWFGGGVSNGTVSYLSGQLDGPEVSTGVKLSSYGRKTHTAIGGATNALGWQLSSRAEVAPLSSHALSISWRSSDSAAVAQSRLSATYFDAPGGVQVGANVSLDPIAVPANNTWQTLSGVVKAPDFPSALFVNIVHLVVFTSEGIKIGTTVDASAGSVEQSDTIRGEYFDGSFPSTFHKRHAWLGTPNNSQSTQTIRTWVK